MVSEWDLVTITVIGQDGIEQGKHKQFLVLVTSISNQGKHRVVLLKELGLLVIKCLSGAHQNKLKQMISILHILEVIS